MKGVHQCSYTYCPEIRRSQTWRLASLTRASIYGLERRTRQPMKPTYAGSVITSPEPPWTVLHDDKAGGPSIGLYSTETVPQEVANGPRKRVIESSST